MRLIIAFLSWAYLIVPTPSLGQGNIQAGEKKSVTCQACHGPKGISSNPLWPNLAGQKDQYMVMQLKAFKNNERKNPIMSPISMTLSEQDMMDLSAYYSSL